MSLFLYVEYDDQSYLPWFHELVQGPIAICKGHHITDVFHTRFYFHAYEYGRRRATSERRNRFLRDLVGDCWSGILKVIERLWHKLVNNYQNYTSRMNNRWRISYSMMFVVMTRMSMMYPNNDVTFSIYKSNDEF